MIGKTVKIDKDILAILYPDYKPLDYVTFLNQEDKIIYTGKPFNNLIKYLEKNTKSFINTVGPPDIDLSSKEALLEYVVNLKGKNMTNKLREFSQVVDDKEFYYCLKLYIINGRLPYDIEKTNSLFDLYTALNESTVKVIKVFNNLCEVYPVPVIEASILSFLNRVAHNQIDGISKRYALLVNNTGVKIGKKLKPSILEYAMSNQSKLDLINLLLNLTS